MNTTSRALAQTSTSDNEAVEEDSASLPVGQRRVVPGQPLVRTATLCAIAAGERLDWLH